MSKIKISTDEYGDSSVTLNVNVPVEVYIGDYEDNKDLKSLNEKQLLHLIDRKIGDIERLDLGEMVLNKMDIERDIERE